MGAIVPRQSNGALAAHLHDATPPDSRPLKVLVELSKIASATRAVRAARS